MAKLEDEYPASITLRFRDEDERNEFLGQLSDGWGENYCRLAWDHERYSAAELRTGKPFEAQTEFGVDLTTFIEDD